MELQSGQVGAAANLWVRPGHLWGLSSGGVPGRVEKGWAIQVGVGTGGGLSKGFPRGLPPELKAGGGGSLDPKCRPATGRKSLLPLPHSMTMILGWGLLTNRVIPLSVPTTSTGHPKLPPPTLHAPLNAPEPPSLPSEPAVGSRLGPTSC